MKTCKKCSVEKPESEFYRDKYAKDGRKLVCKVCCNAHRKKYNQSRKGRVQLKKYRQTPAVKAVNRYHNRKTALKRYSLTLVDYDRLWEQQEGLCAICGKSETTKRGESVQRLSVDHDHRTGKVRGLLCSKCNPALGYLETLKHGSLIWKAIEYLEVNE